VRVEGVAVMCTVVAFPVEVGFIVGVGLKVNVGVGFEDVDEEVDEELGVGLDGRLSVV